MNPGDELLSAHLQDSGPSPASIYITTERCESCSCAYKGDDFAEIASNALRKLRSWGYDSCKYAKSHAGPVPEPDSGTVGVKSWRGPVLCSRANRQSICKSRQPYPQKKNNPCIHNTTTALPGRRECVLSEWRPLISVSLSTQHVFSLSQDSQFALFQRSMHAYSVAQE
jgi:hypothetical protein